MLSKSDFFEEFLKGAPGTVSDSSGIYFSAVSMDSLEEMHKYSTNEKLYEFFEFGAFKCKTETAEYIEKLLYRMSGTGENRNASYWFVRRESDDTLVGTAGLVNLDYGRQSIEWGYGVDPDLWGHGYVLKIQEALKDYVFNVLELNRIHGVTMSTNLRTIESIIAAGMEHEGIAKEHYHKNGEFIDGWRYGMTRSMYESQKSSISKASAESDRISSIVHLVSSIFPEEEITEQSSMSNTDSWDSLGHMQVIIALKEEMNIELSPSHIAEATSIESIVNIINDFAESDR